jgi:hypothetical protein
MIEPTAPIRYLTDDHGSVYDLLDIADWGMICHARYMAKREETFTETGTWADYYDSQEWQAYITARSTNEETQS